MTEGGRRDADRELVPAAGGALAFLGAQIATKPLFDLPKEIYAGMTRARPMVSPAGTPLQELAEFTREEVRAIQGFAREKGVTVPILSAGPKAKKSYFEWRPLDAGGEHIGLNRANVPAAMHEIGHAAPVGESRQLRNVSQLGMWMSKGLPGKALRAALAVNLLRGKEGGEDPEAIRDFAYEHAPALIGASYAPMLLEEARATGHALQGAKAFGPGRMETLKQLAPGYGSYLARALSPVLAAMFAKHVVESLTESGQEKQGAAAKHEVKAPGILRASASSAWRMSPPSMKPKTTRPNTNPSARGKETTKLKPPSKTSYYKDLMKSLHNPQRGFRIAKPG